MTTIPAANAADSLQPKDPAEEGQEQQQPATVTIDGVEIPTDLTNVTDPDLLEYYQTKLAAHKETTDAAAATEAGTEGDGKAPPLGADAPQAGKPEGGDKGPQVPVAALTDERNKRQEAERQLAYAQGQLEVLKTAKPPAAGDGPKADEAPAQTPDQVIATARTEIGKLAARFDAGEITLAKYEEEKAKQDDLIDAARSERLAAKLKPAPQTVVAAPTIDVAKITTEVEAHQARAANARTLEAAHPYAALCLPEVMPTDKAEATLAQSRVDMLRAEADRLARAEDPQIKPGTVQADLLYQKHLAILTDQYGPIWFPTFKPAAPAKGAQASAQPTGGKGPLSPVAQNRLEKLVTQQRQPPNPSDIGSGGGGDGAIDEAAIAKMSDDQIADLPAAVRARFTGARPT